MSYFLHDINALQRGQHEITLDISTYSREEVSILWRALAASSTSRLTLYSLKSPGTLLPSAPSQCSLTSSTSSSSCTLAPSSPPSSSQQEQQHATLPLLSPVLLCSRPNSSHLTYLDLSSNLLDHAFILDLSLALQHNTSLVSLDLGHNLLGDAACSVLANTLLPSNATLRVLILVGNQISNAGALDLVQALRWNASLQALYLLGNRISPGVLALVDEAMVLVQSKAAVLTLRAAQEIGGGKRTSSSSSMRRMPRELVRLVFGMLAGSPVAAIPSTAAATVIASA